MNQKLYLSDKALRKILFLNCNVDGEFLMVLLGERKSENLINIDDALIPEQKGSMGFVEVTDYIEIGKVADKIVGWAHGGGAHRHWSDESGHDNHTNMVCGSVLTYPFISMIVSEEKLAVKFHLNANRHVNPLIVVEEDEEEWINILSKINSPRKAFIKLCDCGSVMTYLRERVWICSCGKLKYEDTYGYTASRKYNILFGNDIVDEYDIYEEDDEWNISYL
jgi:hypothetical protein